MDGEMSEPFGTVLTVDETRRTREAVQAYVESLEQRDWLRFSGLLAQDVLYELPQTRERISSRAALLQFNKEFPGDWHLELRRIVAEGPNAAAWLDTRIGDEHQDACVWFELDDDGRIAKVTDYWPDSYEPPAGREHLTERW
jgi:predicted ester cyclase